MSDEDDYAYAVGEVLDAPFGLGLLASGTGGTRADNPYPVDSADWQDWLRGFQTWEDAPKITVEIPDHG